MIYTKDTITVIFGSVVCTLGGLLIGNGFMIIGSLALAVGLGLVAIGCAELMRAVVDVEEMMAVGERPLDLETIRFWSEAAPNLSVILCIEGTYAPVTGVYVARFAGERMLILDGEEKIG
jgi:hypothetical protein